MRTEQSAHSSERDHETAAAHPIRFGRRPSLGERIVAAARVASAMHLTGSALIAADEAAIRALESGEDAA